MCLIAFAYDTHPDYRLVLAANRDEFYQRPTAPLAFWEDHPTLLAGRDLQQQGTWMGVTARGRIAAITNYRDPGHIKSGAPSRGHLVSDFLLGDMPPDAYLASVNRSAARYNGFNLIVGDATGLFYLSNYAASIRKIEPGIHGLSNHLLDTPWPKVARCKQRLAEALRTGGAVSEAHIWELLTDQTPAADDCLPDTGVDRAWERALSPIFIASPGYGTRCSSLITIDRQGLVRFTEITWQNDQPTPREAVRRSFTIQVASG
jgi:uncharacterized protein with NRDE domain